MEKVYLVLENGEVFEGKSIGVMGDAIGEVSFNTQMLGYLATLTDCSNYGHLVAQTFPLIGNYGLVKSSSKGDKVFLNGYIAREICDIPSNFMSEGKLGDFLVKNNVVGICDIDTRHLTKTIREKGVMNGIITANAQLNDSQKKALNEFKIDKALENTCQKGVASAFSKTAAKKVVVWNFGDTSDIALQLENRGCEVIYANYDAKAEDILALNPQGVVLSNGAGCPFNYPQIVANIQKLCKSKISILGINWGHLALALASGATLEKMKFGHRGANQPIKDTTSGKLFVTSQNHGAVVDKNSIAKASVTYTNINDGTIEGLTYNSKQFSVQFQPVECDGPMSTGFIYDKFISAMEG